MTRVHPFRAAVPHYNESQPKTNIEKKPDSMIEIQTSPKFTCCSECVHTTVRDCSIPKLRCKDHQFTPICYCVDTYEDACKEDLIANEWHYYCDCPSCILCIPCRVIMYVYDIVSYPVRRLANCHCYIQK